MLLDINFKSSSMRFKDKGFKQEKEWRFFANTQPESFADLQFREANGGLVPFVKLPLIEVCVVQIWSITCGPNTSTLLAMKSARMVAARY